MDSKGCHFLTRSRDLSHDLHKVSAKRFSDQSIHNIKAVSIKEGTASALTDVDGGGSTVCKHTVGGNGTTCTADNQSAYLRPPSYWLELAGLSLLSYVADIGIQFSNEGKKTSWTKASFAQSAVSCCVSVIWNALFCFLLHRCSASIKSLSYSLKMRITSPWSSAFPK